MASIFMRRRYRTWSGRADRRGRSVSPTMTVTSRTDAAGARKYPGYPCAGRLDPAHGRARRCDGARGLKLSRPSPQKRTR
jgi:hypothetical protein